MLFTVTIIILFVSRFVSLGRLAADNSVAVLCALVMCSGPLCSQSIIVTHALLVEMQHNIVLKAIVTLPIL